MLLLTSLLYTLGLYGPQAVLSITLAVWLLSGFFTRALVIRWPQSPKIRSVSAYSWLALALVGCFFLSWGASQFWPLEIGGMRPESRYAFDTKYLYFLVPILGRRLFEGLKKQSWVFPDLVMRAWVLFGALLSFYVICQFFTGIGATQAIGKSGYFIPGGLYKFHLSVASVLCVVFFVSLDYRGFFHRFLSLLLFAGVLFSYSRMGWATVGIGILIYILFTVRSFKRKAISTLFLLLLCFGLTQLTWVQQRVVSHSGTTDRYELWKASIEVYKRAPWFGVGFRQSDRMIEGYFKEKFGENHQQFLGHPHQLWLEILVSLGAVGFIIFLLWFLWILRTAFRLSPGLGVAWLSIGLNGMTQVNLIEGKVIHTAAFLISYILFSRLHPVTKKERVAIVHDWLNGLRGGELVLKALLKRFPQADIYTLFIDRPKVSALVAGHTVYALPLDRWKYFLKNYRYFFPFFPYAIGLLRLQKNYSLVISSSHCVAKGVEKSPGSFHVSYVHAPMRYIWSRFEEYFGQGRSPLKIRILALVIRPFLKIWDRYSSRRSRVDAIIANSDYIAEEIRQFYDRKSETIYPFLDLDRFGAKAFQPVSRPKRDNKRPFLFLGAFAPYKRLDLVLEACKALQKPLVIAGSGQEQGLKALYKEVAYFRWVDSPTDEQVVELYESSRALLFAGIEDFGITPLEAMFFGLPVIALKKGGLVETVTDETGVFFEDQSLEGLKAAIQEFERRESSFQSDQLRARAMRFSESRFYAGWNKLLHKSGVHE